MRKLSMREIKEIELKILIEFDRLCKENNLTYYLAFGTLLGAARHGGFIPWDDDIDVMMPRDDYERLLVGFNEWSQSDCYELKVYSDGYSIYPFAKMVNNKTVATENFTRSEFKIGVWMDIFPLDNVNKDDRELFKKEKRVSLLRSFAIADPSVGSSFLVKLVKKIVCPFARALNANKLARRMDEICKKRRNQETEYFAVVSDVNPKWIFPKELFGLSYLSFEGIEFPVPSRFDEWLTIQYGDWNALPPEEEREIHMQEAYALD